MAMSPLPPRSRLEATCHLERVEPLDEGARLHLRTLRPGTFGRRRLRDDAALSLRFRSEAVSDPATATGSLVRRWQRRGTTLRVVVEHRPRGLDYVLTDGLDAIRPSGRERVSQRAA